jgi:uncharacterized protein
MTTTLIRSNDVAPQAWRNGGGVTRELLAWPASDDWRVRVSVADIEADGPFSAWPGVRRWFAVLKGAGVELTIDGTVQRMTRNDAPLAFAGDAATHCRLLDGPTRDLNLMLRGARGGLCLADDGLPWRPDAAQCGLFTAVAGRCQREGHEEMALPAYALLWFDPAPASLQFLADQRPAGATGWWLEATPEESI